MPRVDVVCFSPIYVVMLQNVGQKEVGIKASGKKERITVVLTVSADGGNSCPSSSIFKGKPTEKVKASTPNSIERKDKKGVA